MPHQQGKEEREKPDASEGQEIQACFQILLGFQRPFLISFYLNILRILN